MILRILTYVIFLSSLVTVSLKAQEQVWLHGKVVRKSDQKPIPLAQIASYKKLNMFAADSIGEFRVILDANDSIKILALGFEPRVVHLDSLKVDADLKYIFSLDQTSYQIQQVDINSNIHYNAYLNRLKDSKSKREEMDLMLPEDIKLGQKPAIPDDIRPDYSGPPPVYAAVVAPFRFIDYYTSKTDKNKRRYMKLLSSEKQRSMLTVDLMAEVSGLEGEALQDFIIYCNANIKLNRKDTPLSVKYKVIDLYNAYKEK